jgi:hypothetical protein
MVKETTTKVEPRRLSALLRSLAVQTRGIEVRLLAVKHNVIAIAAKEHFWRFHSEVPR